MLFLAEGAVIGLAGGLLGVALGLVTTVAVADLRGWTPVLSLSLLPVGVLSATAIGLLFATYPAWRATTIEPAVAVRRTE